MTDDVLARICAATRAETARRMAETTEDQIRAIAIAADPPRGFHAALKKVSAPALIAEIKQASPSGGMIRELFAPTQLALDYAAGGATCLSVLTDEPHFRGRLWDMRLARQAVDLPVLRKDFILDRWQVYESRAHGADCILLIVAALTNRELEELESVARMLGMDVLVEVHNRSELDRALALPGKMVGINNRNLKTLQTDLATTRELAQHVPTDRMVVAESGIRSHANVLDVLAAGAHAVLVGESLLRQPDVASAARALLGR